ncbi:MAG: amidohydrolase [Alistipes sp.]|jgi:5-methylthioadenosine/S-adenosylhomocysteine deaminase|nr:amidohydrolase [Alistipes sp.]
MKTLITGAVIVPMTGQDGAKKYFTGSVAIEGNRIVMVTDDRARVEEFWAANPDAREIDGRGKLVMPGLVNTHTHVAMTLMRNLADDLPLNDWLNEKVWPFESHLGPDEIAAGARLGMVEMLLGGTTTLVDMYWHEAAVARAARQTGIRAVLCPSFVDGPRMEQFEADLEATLAAARGCDRLSVMIAPHAAYSCSAENLKRAAELARRHEIGLHIHVSETRWEQQVVRERHGCTPTEYLARLGLFEVPAIAAHCVYVSPGDMEILRGAGVTVAHNPQSNMKLASGAAPVAAMLAAGIAVSIGTDGACSNNDLDMWDEMRSASFLGKLTAGDPAAMPAWEVLRMATVNGARAIGMEGRLGVVAEGAFADLVMLDTEKPHWYPHVDPIAALVYSARASDVERVFVDGRMVVESGRIVGLDTAAAMADVQRITDSVRSRI